MIMPISGFELFLCIFSLPFILVSWLIYEDGHGGFIPIVIVVGIIMFFISIGIHDLDAHRDDKWLKFK